MLFRSCGLVTCCVFLSDVIAWWFIRKKPTASWRRGKNKYWSFYQFPVLCVVYGQTRGFRKKAWLCLYEDIGLCGSFVLKRFTFLGHLDLILDLFFFKKYITKYLIFALPCNNLFYLCVCFFSPTVFISYWSAIGMKVIGPGCSLWWDICSVPELRSSGCWKSKSEQAKTRRPGWRRKVFWNDIILRNVCAAILTFVAEALFSCPGESDHRELVLFYSYWFSFCFVFVLFIFVTVYIGNTYVLWNAPFIAKICSILPCVLWEF